MYQFTSPVDDWSYYEDRGLNVTDDMREEAEQLQDRLGLVLHDQLNYPTEWVVVLDDTKGNSCLLYTSPSPRDVEESRMPSSA